MESLSTNAAGARRRNPTAARLAMGLMVIVLLVAVIFAANSNEIVGWFVVVISGGWLLLTAFLVFGLKRGADKINTSLREATAAAAGRVGASGGATAASPVVIDEGSSQRDVKLDHSFKIVQVQAGVISQRLGKDDDESRAMIQRALETITMTAANARDMMKPSGKPIDGEIID